MVLQLIFVLVSIIIGARLGGIGLGVMGVSDWQSWSLASDCSPPHLLLMSC